MNSDTVTIKELREDFYITCKDFENNLKKYILSEDERLLKGQENIFKQSQNIYDLWDKDLKQIIFNNESFNHLIHQSERKNVILKQILGKLERIS